MELQSNEWFRLPRLGTDVFGQLMRAGVKYDRDKGFLISRTTNISVVEDLLSSALHEVVKVTVLSYEPICFVCSVPVGCRSCVYADSCARNAKFCLCLEHLDSPTAFMVYRLAFMDQLTRMIGAAAEKVDVEVKEGTQWSEKYRPSDLIFMVGNEDIRLGFLRWLSSWKKRMSALLLGPPGVGKTTVVQLAAKKLDMPLMQLNASDERSKTRLSMLLSEGTLSRGLSGKGLLVFLDEVDGIEARADFGAVDFIKDTISSSLNPIVMAANNEDDDVVLKMQGKMTEVFRFHRVMPRLIDLYLRSVIEREGMRIESEEVQRIVVNANGDIRASLNNLQISCSLPQGRTRRDEQASVREAFNRIFAAKDFEEVYRAIELAEISRPSELLRLVFNNIVTNCKDERMLVDALRQISWLDPIVRKMEFEQRWELLRYFRRILAGILVQAKNPGWRYVDYDPAFFANRFRIWNDGRVLRIVSARIAGEVHASKSQSILLYPSLTVMAAKGYKAARKLVCFDDSSEKVCNKEFERLSDIMKHDPGGAVKP